MAHPQKPAVFWGQKGRKELDDSGWLKQPDVAWGGFISLAGSLPKLHQVLDSNGLSHTFDLVMGFWQVLSLSPEGCEYVWVFM